MSFHNHNWYKFAQEQGELFMEFVGQEEGASKKRKRNEFKKIKDDLPNIEYLGYTNLYGSYFVQFKIGINYWIYKISFRDWINIIKQIASKSHGKALNWTKEHASEECQVTARWPGPNTVKRCRDL